MKPRLAEAAQGRLARRPGDDEPMTEEEVVRVLARIARTGRAGDRLRAAELLGRHLGMFREAPDEGGVTLEQLVPGRRRLPEGAVTIQVVDPYAEPGRAS